MLTMVFICFINLNYSSNFFFVLFNMILCLKSHEGKQNKPKNTSHLVTCTCLVK